MQDKLIEAVAKAIFNRRNPKCPNPWEEIANDHLKEEYRADAIAAVRAHDAGKDGAALITAERSRQIAVEGWTSVHDDQHSRGSLARAAECYLICGLNQSNGVGQQKNLPLTWPWGEKWWKPSDDPVRNLVKAGALIAAEIDRLNRPASLPHREPESTQEPPASHAAESAPPIPFEDWWSSQGKFIDPDTEDVPWFDKRKGLAEVAYDAGQSSVKFGQFYSHTKAPSAAQLDAEDQHRASEPGEDVTERDQIGYFFASMGITMSDNVIYAIMKWRDDALAVAREGYWSQQDVEKAIRTAWARDWCGIVTPESFEQFLALIMARLAPKPSLAEEFAKILERSAHLVIDMPRRNKMAAELAALVERRAGK